MVRNIKEIFEYLVKDTIFAMRDGEVVSRMTHNHQVGSSNLSLATKEYIMKKNSLHTTLDNQPQHLMLGGSIAG